MDPPLHPIPYWPAERQVHTDTHTHTKIYQTKCYQNLLDAKGLLLESLNTETYTHTLTCDVKCMLSSVMSKRLEMKMLHKEVANYSSNYMQICNVKLCLDPNTKRE